MDVLYSSVPLDFLNHEMFEQLLELEREDPGFLKDIIKTYVCQATSSLETLETLCNAQNLEEISRVGHLLKGASAALGLSTIASTFERIQKLGKLNSQESLPKVRKEIQLANVQFQMAKEFFNRL